MSKYIKLLEFDLAQGIEREKQLRADLEFYRGKVERLELAIAQTSEVPAQAALAKALTPRPIVGQRDVEQIGQRLPFRELQRRWGAMNETDQEKAMKDGWIVEKEEVHEGSS